MRMQRRSLLKLGALAAASPVALALARVAYTQPVADTLRLAGSDPVSLDPALVRDTTSSSYVVEVFSGLTRLDAALEPVADLATDWTLSENRRSLVFRLRPNTAFHDGRPLTASDVKWSWERALSPDTGRGSSLVFLGDIDGAAEVAAGSQAKLRGVQVISDRMLEVTLTEPSPSFLAKIANPPAMVVDRVTVQAGSDWFRTPNGSGPYRVDEWESGSGIVLVRASTYARTAGGPRTVEFRELDPGEGLLRYEQDEIDVVGVGGPDVERFSDPLEPRSLQLVRTPTLSLQYIGFNAAHPPLDDVHVRRALAMSVDRNRINRVTLRGLQSEARGIVPPGLPEHRPAYSGLAFDPEAARAELAESRYGGAANLPPIILTNPGEGLLADSVTKAVVLPWRTHLGIDVTVEQLDWNGFIGALDTNADAFQVFSLGWSADFADASSFIDVLFGSDQPDNYFRFSDLEVDRLIAQAKRTSGDTRTRLYHQAEARIVEAAALVPLYYGVTYELVQPWVRGFAGQPLVREWLTEIAIDGS